MNIKQLTVQNFRCFKQATFDFSPGFNLFVGINGSGKSSLLKAVAASLATPLNGLGKNSVWLHDQEVNARLALVELKGRVRYERCYPVRLEVTGTLGGEVRSWWMEQMGPGNNQNKWEHTVFAALTEISASISQGGAGALPIVAFYTAERQWKLVGVSAHNAVRQQDSRLDGYASWENAALDMKGLETWVVAKSLERLEAVSDSGPLPSDQPLDELDLVNRAVVEAVPGAKGLRYDIKYRRLVLDWKNAESTPFDALSDGQSGVVALVADMARRMCLLNPQLGDTVLSETPGIVVIDELDMHLHPAWQRRLPGVLKKTFPKVQFIAASHSPQIIGELSASEVWLMRDAKVLGNPERALGLSSSEVLEELMEGKARNVEVTSQLDTIRVLLDADDISSAEEALSRLRQTVGDIPQVLELQASIDSLQWLEDGDA
jgi:predicted ATP-binding protein involved in virulence